MRFAVVAPWKVDPRGPFAAAIGLYVERITRGGPDSLALISPGTTLTDEKSQSDFLLRECTKLHADHFSLLCLDESGRTEPSGDFARRIDNAAVRGARGLAFVLGGAYGLPAALADFPRLEALSLSPLTFAHELALTVLLEQIYRAQCIRAGHPYHHGVRSGFAKVRRVGGAV